MSRSGKGAWLRAGALCLWVAGVTGACEEGAPPPPQATVPAGGAGSGAAGNGGTGGTAEGGTGNSTAGAAGTGGATGGSAGASGQGTGGSAGTGAAGAAGGAGASATEPEIQWAVRLGGSQLDAALGAAIDPAGNTYVVGVFQGQAQFGSLTLQATALLDGFLVKLDPSGEVLWARRFGGTGLDPLWGVGTDAEGNVYIGGTFDGTLDSELGKGTSLGQADMYLARVSPAGDLVWSKTLGSAGGDALWSLDVQPDGRVTASGMIGGPGSLGGGPLGGNWGRAAMVTLDADGNHLFSRDFTDKDAGGRDELMATALSPSGDRFAVVLYANAFYPEEDAPAPPWADGQEQNPALLRLDPGGKATLVRAFPNQGVDFTRGLAVDAKGRALVPFTFVAPEIDLGAGPVPSAGGLEGALALYEPDGTLVWGRTLGGKFADGASSTAFDAQGDAYALLLYGGTVDFGAGPVTSSKIPAGGLLKLSPEGKTRWLLDLGGTPLTQEPLYGTVSADTFGGQGVVVASRFTGVATLGTTKLQSAGDSDALVVRISR